MVDFAQVVWSEQLEDDCRQIIRLAVREDLDRFVDWTTVSLVPPEARGEARMMVREAGVLSGMRVAQLVVDETQADLTLDVLHQDGDSILPRTCVGKLSGAARDLLTTERIILNFIGRLSGIASLTSRFVNAVQGTSAQIYDTRKTTPGWRRLEKYAVGTGGGRNHRVGLFAAVMIKDNHLALSGELGLSPARAIERVRSLLAATDAATDELPIEVEVDTYEQFLDVLPHHPDMILLDNMPSSVLAACVDVRDKQAPAVQLEASGGISLETVREIAETGVDRISVGALTHSALSLDVGLDWT